MVLTDAGRQLLADAGPLLASAHAVRRRVSVAARGSRRLVVGFRTGIPVIPAARAFGSRHPDVVVDVQRMEWDDQAPMLLDGRVDVGCVRLPIDGTGLRVTPLYTEPLMVVLPAGHRLAGKEEVTEADLAGEPLVWHADPSTQPTRRPHPDSGPRVRGVEEKPEHVAAGRGISFVGRSETVFYSRPDISYGTHPGTRARPGVPRGGGITHLAAGRRLRHRGAGDGRDHGGMWELRFGCDSSAGTLIWPATFEFRNLGDLGGPLPAAFVGV